MVCILAAIASLFANSVHAMEFSEINAQQLKAKMDSGEKLLLINPLSDIEFKDANIPGSVNIPLEYLLITENLPKDKNHLIVTYCLGRF
jgi:rhodanese-related sulfurtransferase